MPVSQKYNKPPVVEAILHVRFAAEFSASDLERMPRLLNSQYPKSKAEADFELQFEFGTQTAKPPKAIPVDTGVRLTSANDQKIIVVRKTHIIFGFRAPYQGWDEFYSSARLVFDTVREKLSYKPIKGIGLRYVNRIDIPIAQEGALVTPSDYLTVSVGLPNTAITAITRGFQSVTEIELNHDRLVARVVSATADPALINHASLLLDIDIIAEREIPQKAEEFWAFVGRMRDSKNALFETLVTDRARALFRPAGA